MGRYSKKQESPYKVSCEFVWQNRDNNTLTCKNDIFYTLIFLFFRSRILRQISNSSNWVKIKEEKVRTTILRALDGFLRDIKQPTENDILQFGEIGDEDTTRFYNWEGNRKFRNFLNAEGYYEEYRKAFSNDKNRLDIIEEIPNKVLARLQTLVSPMR